VAALAIGRERHQVATRPLGGGELDSADRQAGLAVALERSDPQVREAPTRLLHPRCVLARQEAPAGREESDLGGTPRARPVLLGDGRVGAMDRPPSACASSRSRSGLCTRCAWKGIGDALRELDTPDGFAGPCELIVAGGRT
jgi:hypothetical protein